MLFEFQTQVARLLRLRGRQCLDVRRLDRLLGSDRHGAADHAAEEGDHLVGPAPALCRVAQDDGASSPATRSRRRCPSSSAATDAERLIASDRRRDQRVVVQYPDILGRITDLTPIAEAAHAAGALLIAVVTEPVALGLIKSPGEMGADIVVGEGQSIGVGLQFGGPYVGLFATAARSMSGRCRGGWPARPSTPRASAASC